MRPIAVFVLAILLLLIVVAAYVIWQNRGEPARTIAQGVTERVFWPDGSLRFEYTYDPQGDPQESFLQVEPHGSKSQAGWSGRQPLSPVAVSVTGPAGNEVFVFPGNSGQPDLVVRRSLPSQEQIDQIVAARAERFGLSAKSPAPVRINYLPGEDPR